ncbi:hypothetical protein Hypma_001961 [Hypsizygus marmoreus]|uniref:Uncharacterized protein n=1 Tax=Hypsizygus marmoreus TaxID=39966 RepID=A0A369J642_HYPMA|nr:hypothetical protein Hypma_001961 [Hypsizygus marmoreus]
MLGIQSNTSSAHSQVPTSEPPLPMRPSQGSTLRHATSKLVSIPAQSGALAEGTSKASNAKDSGSQTIIAHQRYYQQDPHSAGSIMLYTQFRGRGAPPLALGKPGDLWIDTTPNAHRLFIRYALSWREWPGVYRPGLTPSPDQFLHPNDPTRLAWCSSTDILWYKRISVTQARSRLFQAKNIPSSSNLITAHELIKQSGVLTRGVEAAQWSGRRGRPSLRKPTTLDKSSTFGKASYGHIDDADDNDSDVVSFDADGKSNGYAPSQSSAEVPVHKSYSLRSATEIERKAYRHRNDSSGFYPSARSSPLSPVPESAHESAPEVSAVLPPPSMNIPAGQDSEEEDYVDNGTSIEKIANEMNKILKLEQVVAQRATTVMRRQVDLEARSKDLAQEEGRVVREKRELVRTFKGATSMIPRRKEEVDSKREDLEHREAEIIKLEEGIAERERALGREKQRISLLQKIVSRFDSEG